MYNVGDIT